MDICNAPVSVKKKKTPYGAAMLHVTREIQKQTMNRVGLDIKYNEAILIKCDLRPVLNDVRDGESLRCSGKSFHNVDAAESNDLSPQDLLVLILL